MPPCLDRDPLSVPPLMIFCKRPSTPWAAELLRSKPSNVSGLCCFFMSDRLWETTRRPRQSVCPLDKYNVGEVVGPPAISPSKIILAAAERPLFPPLDQALIQAMACEVVAETKEPLSRQSLADLVRRGRATLGKKISRSTVWRMLHKAAIKPWQYEHWIFPRDPRFAEKAGPILDLYAGTWEGKPLRRRITCCAWTRRRAFKHVNALMTKCRPSQSGAGGLNRDTRGRSVAVPGSMGRTSRDSSGALRGEDRIEPFGRLVDQVLEQEPYRDAERLFYVVDNGSSHRGQTSVERIRRRNKRIILVHTPVHASWLNQVEIYFSIIQRKVLTPNDFATLDAVRLRLALYEQLSNRTPRPFAWKFTRQDLLNWLKRAAPHFLAASAA